MYALWQRQQVIIATQYVCVGVNGRFQKISVVVIRLNRLFI